LFENKTFSNNEIGFIAKENSLVKINDVYKFSFETFTNGLLTNATYLPFSCQELKNCYGGISDIRKNIFLIEKQEISIENQKSSLVSHSIILIKSGKMCGFKYENLQSVQKIQLENKTIELPTYEIVEIMNDCKSIVEKLL